MFVDNSYLLFAGLGLKFLRKIVGKNLKSFNRFSLLQDRPSLGLICGSGLGSLASLVKDAVVLPYNMIPNFPVSTAPGHSGRLVIGKDHSIELSNWEAAEAG